MSLEISCRKIITSLMKSHTGHQKARESKED